MGTYFFETPCIYLWYGELREVNVTDGWMDFRAFPCE